MTRDQIIVPPDVLLADLADRIAELSSQISAAQRGNQLLVEDARRWRWITRDGRIRELRIPSKESKKSIDAAIDKQQLDDAWKRDPDQ